MCSSERNTLCIHIDRSSTLERSLLGKLAVGQHLPSLTSLHRDASSTTQVDIARKASKELNVIVQSFQAVINALESEVGVECVQINQKG